MSGPVDVSESRPGIPKNKVFSAGTDVDFFARFELGQMLGQGGFSVVRKGMDKQTGQLCAVKVVDRSKYDPGDNSLAREIEVLAQVEHKNCIKMHLCYITPTKVYIVTELVTGGELLDRVMAKGNYTEKHAAELIQQIVEGVMYLHTMGIVHRDLKLENLLLQDESDESPVKIADFGLSKYFTYGSVLETMCGSPQYVAPEIVGAAGGDAYTPAVDMWSVGVILYILLAGYSPFDDDNDAVLFEKIKKGEYDMDDTVWDDVSEEAKQVIRGLLCVDPNKRLTARAALEDLWVQGKIRVKRDSLLSTQKNAKRTRAKRLSQQSSVAEDEAGIGAVDMVVDRHGTLHINVLEPGSKGVAAQAVDVDVGMRTRARSVKHQS